MSRKPIDEQQPSECRQAIWDEIQTRNSPFTIIDIAKCVRLKPSSVREYLIGLTKANYLEATYDQHNRVVTLLLINDTGNEAPRVRKDGRPVTQGQGRQQMWNTMRILKEFSVPDLAFNSTTDDHAVALSEAKTYCAALCKAGYLIGRANQRFSLLPSKWTGPQPPQIQRTKQIYDPNLKKVVWWRIEGGTE